MPGAADHRPFRGVVSQPAGLEVDTLGRVDRAIRIGAQHLSCRPVNDIDIAVALGPDEHAADLAARRKVEEQVLVDRIVVEEVVRDGLVEPPRLAGVRVPGEDAAGPLVVARPLIGIPRAWIAGAVVDQIQLGIV
jgi:hypothetical protein